MVIDVAGKPFERSEPGALSQIEVEILSSVTHIVTLKKLHSWLKGGAKTPKDAVLKERFA